MLRSVLGATAAVGVRRGRTTPGLRIRVPGCRVAGVSFAFKGKGEGTYDARYHKQDWQCGCGTEELSDIQNVRETAQLTNNVPLPPKHAALRRRFSLYVRPVPHSRRSSVGCTAFPTSSFRRRIVPNLLFGSCRKEIVAPETTHWNSLGNIAMMLALGGWLADPGKRSERKGESVSEFGCAVQVSTG